MGMNKKKQFLMKLYISLDARCVSIVISTVIYSCQEVMFSY